MNGLAVVNEVDVSTIDSRDVAGMVKKQHKELLRDIRTYIDQMNEANKDIGETSAKLRPSDYFIEESYIGGNGEKRPKYGITKIGCDFIANKLTGVKGTAFTAMYTKKFDVMERALKSPLSISDYKRKEIEARYNNSIVRKVRELRHIADNPTVPESYQQIINSKITEMLTGQYLLPLPAAEKTYTATEIGDELGLSANKIGRIANDLGLKTPEFAVQVWDKSPNSAKQVPTWRYKENGRAAIKKLMREGLENE